MSWWAPTVLGGDPALELLDELLTRVNIQGIWLTDSSRACQRVASYGSANYLHFILNNPPHDPQVAAQVVAVVHMVAGVPIPKAVLDMVFHSCRTGHLGWCGALFHKRQAALEQFAALVCEFQDGAFVRLHQPHVAALMGSTKNNETK